MHHLRVCSGSKHEAGAFDPAKVTVLKKGVLVDLKQAIESNADDETFEKLDDTLDASGASMSEDLGRIESSVLGEMTEASADQMAKLEFAANRDEPRLFQMSRAMRAAASPRGGSTARSSRPHDPASNY
jgi:hypothetical protein